MDAELLIRLRNMLLEEHGRMLGQDMGLGKLDHRTLTVCKCQVAQDYRTIKALLFRYPAGLTVRQ